MRVLEVSHNLPLSLDVLEVVAQKQTFLVKYFQRVKFILALNNMPHKEHIRVCAGAEWTDNLDVCERNIFTEFLGAVQPKSLGGKFEQ